jgi:two-component system sensor histidine kinase RegB
VAELQRRAAQEDGIVRMGLLASSAAHELGTPLASLDVILSDWRRVPNLASDPVLAEEMGEMQQAVARCKAIVTDVLQAAGEPRGEAPETVASRDFLEEMADEWRTLHPGEPLFLDVRLNDEPIIADPSLRQAIWNLLENAREASPMAVSLTAKHEDGHLRIEVTDRGAGFTPEALARIGEPHQSAKGPGHGVGLFLTANIVRKLGGRLEAANRAGAPGAIVTLMLPIAAIGATEAAKRWTRTVRSPS